MEVDWNTFFVQALHVILIHFCCFKTFLDSLVLGYYMYPNLEKYNRQNVDVDLFHHFAYEEPNMRKTSFFLIWGPLDFLSWGMLIIS